MKKEQWPNFFIAGVSRAGTTSLYNYLKETPSVYMSPRKGPNYFGNFDPKGITDIESYLELFKDVKNEKAVGEASDYFNSQTAAEKIHNTIPHAKIIISLRNPVERTFSHYLEARKGGYEKEPWDEIFKKNMIPLDTESYFYRHFVRNSFYYKSMKRWLEIFGENQVKVIIFEEFVQNPKKTLEEILKFLEVYSDIPSITGKAFNPYEEPLGDFVSSIVNNQTIKKVAKTIMPGKSGITLLRTILNKRGSKPKISQETRKVLEELYKEDVLKLKTLLKRDLPWEFANI